MRMLGDNLSFLRNILANNTLLLDNGCSLTKIIPKILRISRLKVVLVNSRGLINTCILDYARRTV